MAARAPHKTPRVSRALANGDKVLASVFFSPDRIFAFLGGVSDIELQAVLRAAEAIRRVRPKGQGARGGVSALDALDEVLGPAPRVEFHDRRAKLLRAALKLSRSDATEPPGPNGSRGS